jgi:hypothetical protein
MRFPLLPHTGRFPPVIDPFEFDPDDEPEPSWDQIGELDPRTGHGNLDLRRAGGWRPLFEFLRGR